MPFLCFFSGKLSGNLSHRHKILAQLSLRGTRQLQDSTGICTQLAEDQTVIAHGSLDRRTHRLSHITSHFHIPNVLSNMTNSLPTLQHCKLHPTAFSFPSTQCRYLQKMKGSQLLGPWLLSFSS